MKTFRTLLICTILALGFTACEQDDLLQEEELLVTANSTTTVEAVIIGNRNKLKQKPRRNYKSVIVVDDPTNSVTSAVVQYTPLEGDNPFPEPFEMQVSTIRKSIRKMQKTQSMLNDTSLFPVGTPFQQTVSLYNELGEQVGDVSETWVTAQDNDGTDLNRVSAQEVSQNVISISTKVHSDQRDNIGEIYARVELYGRILIKGQPLEMERTLPEEDTDNGNTLTATTTAQLQDLTGGDIVLPGDELIVSITVTSVDGTIIDEDYFILEVEEKEQPFEISNQKHIVRGNGTTRIKGTVVPRPTSGVPDQPSGPATARLFIPQGNADGSDLALDLELNPLENNEDRYRFNTIIPSLDNFPVGTEYDATYEIYDGEGTVLTTSVCHFKVESTPTSINNTTVQVFGQAFYLEARVLPEAGVQVDRINATILPQEGQDFEPFELELEPRANQGNGPAIRFESVSFTNPTFVGATDAQQSILAQMTLIDTDGNTVLASEEEVQVELLEGITRNPKHIIRPNGITRIRMRLNTPIAQDVAYATMQIPSDIAAGDSDIITLEASSTSDNDPIYRIDGDFVYTYQTDDPDDSNYSSEVTTYNSLNEPIGAEIVEFNITDNREGSNPTATVCMDNGETPFSFNITIESDDSDLQQLDILTLQFLNNGEIFSVQESYDLPRTGTNGDKATFTLSNFEFLNLNEVTNGLMVLTSPLADAPYTSSLSFNQALPAAVDFCLGYFNEDTGNWECEDIDEELDGSELYCGTTDHL